MSDRWSLERWSSHAQSGDKEKEREKSTKYGRDRDKDYDRDRARSSTTLDDVIWDLKRNEGANKEQRMDRDRSRKDERSRDRLDPREDKRRPSKDSLEGERLHDREFHKSYNGQGSSKSHAEYVRPSPPAASSRVTDRSRTIRSPARHASDFLDRLNIPPAPLSRALDSPRRSFSPSRRPLSPIRRARSPSPRGRSPAKAMLSPVIHTRRSRTPRKSPRRQLSPGRRRSLSPGLKYDYRSEPVRSSIRTSERTKQAFPPPQPPSPRGSSRKHSRHRSPSGPAPLYIEDRPRADRRTSYQSRSPRRRSPSPKRRRSPSPMKRPKSPQRSQGSRRSQSPEQKRLRIEAEPEEKLPTVFLANIPRRVRRDTDLEDMFNRFGRIGRINLITKRNNRIAFVSFFQMSHAQRAVVEMNNKRFDEDEAPLKVELSHQSCAMEGAHQQSHKSRSNPKINKDHDTVVRLANIPTGWREEDVRDWCDMYGMILALEIKTRGGQRHGKKRNKERSATMAYVQFSRPSEARAAAEGLHKKTIQNRTIRAYVGDQPSTSAGMMDDADGIAGRCVNCRLPGHKMKECNKPFQCFLCGQSGHVAIYCRHWKTVQSTHQCLNCGNNHLLMECPSQLACSTCGQDGHLAHFCRATSCHNCGDPKHKYNQCPRPMFCMNCGSRQHTKNICQQPPTQSTTVACTMSAQEATEEYILSIFGQFGRVVQLRQNRRPSITHAFVYFSGKKMEKHAIKACKKVVKEEFLGNMLTVEPATSSSAMRENSVTIFVGNLPVSVTEDQVKHLFHRYKTFAEVKIHRATMLVEVVYEDTESAKKACLMLQGTEWGGPPLTVELRRDALPPVLPAKRKRSQSSSSSSSSSRSSSSSSSSRSYSGSSSSSSGSSSDSSRRASRRRRRSRRSRKSRRGSKRKSKDRSRSRSGTRSRSRSRSRSASRSKRKPRANRSRSSSRSRDPGGRKLIDEGWKVAAEQQPVEEEEERPLPAGWCSAVDPATKVRYYIHIATRTSQWVFPISADPPNATPTNEDTSKAPAEQQSQKSQPPESD